MAESKLSLKQEYKRLQQLGKDKEASLVLQKLLNFGKEQPKKVVETLIKVGVKEEVEIPKESKKKEKLIEKLEDLSEIKGIGDETLEDICSIYNSLEDLKNDLKNKKKIPLRNDIVKKLNLFLF